MILTSHKTGGILIFTLLTLLLIGTTGLLLPTITGGAQDVDPTLDAAIQQAFTQTAQAAQLDPTEAFQMTVDAAIAGTLTATAQPQQTEAPQVTPTPTNTVAPVATPTRELTLSQRQVFDDHGDTVTAVAINGNGRFVASSGADGTVRVWRVEDGQAMATLQHDASVLDVAFNPASDTEEVISVDENGTVRRWNWRDGEELPLDADPTIASDGVDRLPASGGGVIAGFAPSGEQFATFDFGGYLGLWDTPANTVTYRLPYSFALADFSSEMTVLAYTLPNEPNIVRVGTPDGQVMQQFEYSTAFVEPVAFSNNGSRLIVLGDDGLNRVVDLSSGTTLFEFEYTGYGLSAFSPDGAIIADGNANGRLNLYDGTTGTRIGTTRDHDGLITEVAFGPDGDLIATAGEDGTVRVYTIGKASADIDPAPQQASGPTPLPDGFPDVVQADVQVAEQVFEGGRMFWVQPANQIWVMVVNDNQSGEWLIYEDTFDEDTDPESDPDLDVPAGNYQPVRGFGKLWRENEEVRDILGWAVTPEFGYISRYEYVPGGEIADEDYVPGPGFHVLFSLNGEAFRFNEDSGTWQLGRD